MVVSYSTHWADRVSLVEVLFHQPLVLWGTNRLGFDANGLPPTSFPIPGSRGPTSSPFGGWLATALRLRRPQGKKGLLHVLRQWVSAASAAGFMMVSCSMGANFPRRI